MVNTYLTAHDYLKAATGQETASLVGNLCRLSAGVAAGATSLPVAPVTTVALNAGDSVYVFDGSATELVTVASSTAAGAASIPVSATSSAHLVNTSVVTDGARGSLGDAIIEGSAVVERLTRQPLLQATVTEALPLMTTRASVDNNSTLWIRPRQAPVTAVSAIQVKYTASDVVTLDAGQALTDAGGWLVSVPVIKAAGATQLWNYASQVAAGQAIISYTAGYAYSALPGEIRRAAVMLISDLLSDRLNPTGAAEVAVGKTHTVQYLRGDTAGESALYKRARALLRRYTQGSF